MARYAAKVVEVEGPVHENEVITRIRSAWGLGRAGNRIRDAVLSGLRAAQRGGHVEAAGSFWSKPGETICVRDRSEVRSITLRKPEHIPPREIEAAILQLLDANFGAARDELVSAVARLFGFASTSMQLRSVIEASLHGLLSQGAIEIQGDQVKGVRAATIAVPAEVQPDRHLSKTDQRTSEVVP